MPYNVKDKERMDKVEIWEVLVMLSGNEISLQEAHTQICSLSGVGERTLGFASCASIARSMPLGQAIQMIKSDITGIPTTAVIGGKLVVKYVR